MSGTVHIGVDVGGTFTDFAVSTADGTRNLLHKLPSTPAKPEEAILRGLRDVLEIWNIEPSDIGQFSHGTTVGTNALIQRRTGRLALVTSEGFRDLLEIGRQTRPKVYDIHSDHPKPLVDRALRFEVPQRRLADGRVRIPLDARAVARLAAPLQEAAVDCVVVCFLHSYAYPEDELHASEILRSNLPDSVSVITSASVYPEFREYERFSTAVLNAALLTVVGSYLDRLTSGLEEIGLGTEVKVSQSSGGLMSAAMARHLPIRASLSGPAAGVQGAANRALAGGWGNIITLDVGGTSADVSLMSNGQPVEVHERTLAGFPIRLPALDVNAVGAGGGSVAWIDPGGLLKVGPHSAGARPGPACYDLGGAEPTVTDANVLLGRLDAGALLDGRMPIRKDLAEGAVAPLARDLGLDLDETALGIVKVACATIIKAVRSISIERGRDPRDFVLFVYGGAGALHAVDLAKELEIKTVVVPPNPGILCAEGAMKSALTNDFVKTILAPLDDDLLIALNAARGQIKNDVTRWFDTENIPGPYRETRWSIDLRYHGQNYELNVPLDDSECTNATLVELERRFHAIHEANYGFSSQKELVQVVNLRVKAIGRLSCPDLQTGYNGAAGKPYATRQVMFAKGDWRKASLYRRDTFTVGQVINGPAVIEQMDATTIVFPGDLCEVDAWGNMIIRLGKGCLK